MPGYIRVWVKMIIDFIFSVSIITGVLSYALLKSIPDGLNILFIKGAGSENMGIIMEGNVPEFVLRNILWFSVFVFCFSLIILFFMEPRLKVFLFPGSLCFLSIFFIQAALIILNSFITPDTTTATKEFADLFFKQAGYASLVVGGTGMILLIISCFNLFQARKEAQSG